jgi:hypothetical protein
VVGSCGKAAFVASAPVGATVIRVCAMPVMVTDCRRRVDADRQPGSRG